MRAALIASALFCALAAPALAQTCTKEMADEKIGKLFNFATQSEANAEKANAAVAKVEKEYGGEPSGPQVCEAMDKIFAILKISD